MGRPPAGHAGVIDARIVEAAREAFLEHGFAAASLEQIAQRARISKMTLYGRYRTKVALFEGMMQRCVEQVLAVTVPVPHHLALRDRLMEVSTDE